jgi:dynein heavy chain
MMATVYFSLKEVFRDSAARFMAFAHTSVNAASRVFLANERRYNYTTPKSYLEQISLYSKLLRQKNSELTGKVERLENGLEKLKSTAEQVFLHFRLHSSIYCCLLWQSG